MKKQNIDSQQDQAVPSTALTKRELVGQIALDTDLTQQQVFDIVQRTLDGITATLSTGRHVEFREFGVFEVVERKARIGRNPHKPEDTVMIPTRKVVKFKPGKRMRETLENK